MIVQKYSNGYRAVLAERKDTAPAVARARIQATGNWLMRFWYAPPGLERTLVLEWRFVAVRWIGLLAVVPALWIAHLDPAHQTFALGVAGLATIYNLVVSLLLRRVPALLRSGYLTSLGDAALNIAMIMAVGGFDSPFYYLLFTVTISAAMRYGYGQAAAMVGMYVGLDGFLGYEAGRQDWTAFVCRSGFLAITAILAGYLREQARAAEEALSGRLRQARLLDEACHMLGASLEVGQVRDLTAQAGCHLLGGQAAWLLPISESATGTAGSWSASLNAQAALPALERAVHDTGPDLLTPMPGNDATRIVVLAVGIPERGKQLARLGVELLPEAKPIDTEVLARFTERASLALENAGLYQELALRHAHVRAQADSDPLTGLLNHRALLSKLDEAITLGQTGGLLLLDIDNFKLFNDTFGHLTGDAVLHQTAEVLREQCPERAHLGRYGGDEFLVFVPQLSAPQTQGLADQLSAAMRQLEFLTPDGAKIPLSVSIGVTHVGSDARTRRELLLDADEAMYREKRGGQDYGDLGITALREESSFRVLEGLVLAVDRKDRYTREHSLDVMRLALLLAEQLRLSTEERRVLALAGSLHDVGKIAIPDTILRKPGRLAAAEYASVQTHVAYGVAFIRGVLPQEEVVIEAVLHHHERWDGRGYPNAVAGPDTPLLGRIMQVADAVSAMMLDRPYRMGLAWSTVTVELRKASGTQFDPALVEPFINAVEATRSDTSATVESESGESTGTMRGRAYRRQSPASTVTP